MNFIISIVMSFAFGAVAGWVVTTDNAKITKYWNNKHD